jgi:hypothetical protein
MPTAIFLVSVLYVTLVTAGAQTTKHEAVNKDIQQGQTPPEETGPLRGRTRFERNPTVFRGTLIDGSCADRSWENLAQAPQAPQLAPAQPRNLDAAKGIQVNPKTLESERADVMTHQVPDLRARMADATCAVTGNTKAFAILLDNGRVMNLDEGGNTLALEAVQSSSDGRAMLNGMGPALKPKISIEAYPFGDRLMVKRIVITSL